MSLLQVIPLGGSGEIGKNCTVVKQGDDIIVIDCGISFPTELQYGVDVIIPDFTYLLEHKDQVRGIFLTHAHEDHVGALSYLLPDLDVPIYCTPFTEAMLRSKLEERRRGLIPKINRMQPGDKVQVGSFTVEPVLVTHSIPETCAMAIKTEYGHILFTADFKFDPNPVDGRKTNLKRLAELGEEGVLLLVSDSTNVDRPGWGPSESEVLPSLKEVFEDAAGRVLITMFSSSIHRMQQVIEAAHSCGRRVAVGGRRMEATMSLSRSLGMLTAPKDTLIALEEIGDLPANRQVIIVTGSQGEPMAALSQMARGEYQRLKVQEGDTILYSARPIPGNEGAIWRTVNNLIRRKAKVIIDSNTPIHVSGHAYMEEIKMMLALTKPFYVAPVHGEPRHQQFFQEMLMQMGHAAHRVFVLENGDTLNMDQEKAWIGEQIQAGEVMIDQHGQTPVTPVALQERQQMAREGLVVVTTQWSKKSRSFQGRPRLQFHGFAAADHLLEDIEEEIIQLISSPRAKLDTLENAEDTLCEAARRAVQRISRQRSLIVAEVLPV